MSIRWKAVKQYFNVLLFVSVVDSALSGVKRWTSFGNIGNKKGRTKRIIRATTSLRNFIVNEINWVNQPPSQHLPLLVTSLSSICQR